MTSKIKIKLKIKTTSKMKTATNRKKTTKDDDPKNEDDIENGNFKTTLISNILITPLMFHSLLLSKENALNKEACTRTAFGNLVIGRCLATFF